MRVDDGQLRGDPVVLPHPHRVRRRQAGRLVGSAVAGREAVDVGLRDPALALEGRPVQRRQKRLANSELVVGHHSCWGKSY